MITKIVPVTGLCKVVAKAFDYGCDLTIQNERITPDQITDNAIIRFHGTEEQWLAAMGRDPLWCKAYCHRH